MHAKKIILTFLIMISFMKSNATCSIVQNTGLVFNNCEYTDLEGCKTQANISLSCSSSTSISLSLSQGNSNQFNPRQLKDPDSHDVIDYNVFIDAPNTIIFGDGTQSTATISSNCNGTCNFVVYGRVLSNIKNAGNYIDNQTYLTVSY